MASSSSSSAVEAATSSAAGMEGGELSLATEEITLAVKWSGKEYTVRVCGDDSVAELKRRICEVTTVLPKRQKLLYPKLAAKLGDDSLLISQLNLKPGVKMTMIGTIEDEIIVDQVDSPEIIDDFELGQDEVIDIKDKFVNKQKLLRRISHYKIKLLNPCRQGKKLLVLDIDYTLFDHKSAAENPHELMRPYLHEFLSAVYAEYDIMIWSATGMKWVELKMGQLGVLNNPNYKITALLDHMAMITVQSDFRGMLDCKPLGLIWAQFPEFYSSTNTIMFDDLRRNFVMNPQNGLTIKPFRKAHLNRSNDQELLRLTQYLLAIAELPDLSQLDHNIWELYAEDGPKRRRHI
ncbi:ubiquitin-like domain-containing CTD phosphatase isoform X2 [Zingiber officinale]|uniref:ubiquitin-like domain-containing CTD phosphatase isoform X2 n=1 Tax=Zingiber officinale TaxID=94328 RepID=UPI001C4CCDEF|nr:ubiquitin-like domain-containing CTD phosphatase isoform X2 [Zingiber officinale]